MGPTDFRQAVYQFGFPKDSPCAAAAFSSSPKNVRPCLLPNSYISTAARGHMGCAVLRCCALTPACEPGRPTTQHAEGDNVALPWRESPGMLLALHPLWNTD